MIICFAITFGYWEIVERIRTCITDEQIACGLQAEEEIKSWLYEKIYKRFLVDRTDGLRGSWNGILSP